MISVIVEISTGWVKSVTENGVEVFRGIPYAAPPIGRFRFKSPQPPLSWSGVRLCDEYGPIAPQKHDPLGFRSDLPQSEDCLSLNVWTSGESGKPRPVMVYIHGGGFIAGKSAECDGHRYALENDIVYVSVNYRLGALGFMYLGDLLGEEYVSSGNNGMLDIVAALRWVQANIAAFGGDPRRVTVNGNSAGAKCTSALYTVSAADGLFRGAIAQSGATQAIRDCKTANETSLSLLSSLGLKKKEAVRLLEVPAEQLIEAQNRIGPDLSRSLHMFGPVADGVTIPLYPLKVVARKRGLPPLLIGTNEDEAAIFIKNEPDLHSPSRKAVDHLFGLNGTIVWSSYQTYAMHMPQQDAWSRALTEHLYVIGSAQFAEAISITGTPVWMYRLTYKGKLGATHGYENCLIHYLEETDTPIKVQEDPFFVAEEASQLAAIMRSVWSAFVHENDPNVEQLPVWPCYGAERSTMVFDLDCRVRTDLSIPIGEIVPHQVWRSSSCW